MCFYLTDSEKQKKKKNHSFDFSLTSLNSGTVQKIMNPSFITKSWIGGTHNNHYR